MDLSDRVARIEELLFRLPANDFAAIDRIIDGKVSSACTSQTHTTDAADDAKHSCAPSPDWRSLPSDAWEKLHDNFPIRFPDMSADASDAIGGSDPAWKGIAASSNFDPRMLPTALDSCQRAPDFSDGIPWAKYFWCGTSKATRSTDGYMIYDGKELARIVRTGYGAYRGQVRVVLASGLDCWVASDTLYNSDDNINW